MYTNIKEYRNKLLITEFKDNVLSFKVDDSFKPRMFVESIDTSEYKGYPNNTNLQEIQFDNIKEFKSYSNDIKKTDEIVYGNIQAEYQYIQKFYKKDEIVKPRTHFMDIETNVEDEFPDPVKAIEPIIMMQVYDNIDDNIKIFCWQRGYTNKLEDDVDIIVCEDEKNMIETWLTYYYDKKPAMVVGWNFLHFDLRYITNRLRNLGYKDGILSPFSVTEKKNLLFYNENVEIEKPVGIVWMDYKDIFDKYAYIKTPDKKLDTVAQTVLGIGEGKLDWKEYFKSFKDMTHNKYSIPLHPSEEHKKSKIYNLKINNASEEEIKQEAFNIFVEYSILDVRLLKEIDNKLQLSSLAYGYAWSMGINIEDILGTVKPWTMLAYHELLEYKLVIPSKIDGHPFYKPVGGYWEANPGLYKWIMSQDFTSLYPLNAVALNMSPDTIVSDKDIPNDLLELVKPIRRYLVDDVYIDREDNMNIYIDMSLEVKLKIKELLNKYDLSMSTNGVFFRKDHKGMLPIMIEKIFNQRKAYKKLMKEADIELSKIKKAIKNK